MPMPTIALLLQIVGLSLLGPQFGPPLPFREQVLGRFCPVQRPISHRLSAGCCDQAALPCPSRLRSRVSTPEHWATVTRQHAIPRSSSPLNAPRLMGGWGDTEGVVGQARILLSHGCSG
ncbi:hypothetical protein GQ53DRAFT_749244 [Thozetella sp. PMI_491]|nr:hypothetical protein GQ53DRAFT_749244 [Thozetella sp. PMI_491]